MSSSWGCSRLGVGRGTRRVGWRWCRCCSSLRGCRIGRRSRRCGPGSTGSTRWGLELTDAGFDHSVLSEFRDRLIDNSAEQRILDVVLGQARRAGLLAAGGRARTDSTHVSAAVRGLNRLELAGETLRAALNAVAAAAPDWLRPVAAPDWFDRYGLAGGGVPAAPRGPRPHRAGRRRRDAVAGCRPWLRGAGLAAPGAGGAGAAADLGAAVPRGRGEGALAGEQRSPAGQSPAGLAV